MIIRASIWNGEAGCEYEVEDDQYNALAADDVRNNLLRIYREAFECEPDEVTVEEIESDFPE
jgi:hypothetical protein